MTSAGLLIYDADCGFCTASARWVADRSKDSVDIAAWQATDLGAHGLTSEQASTSVQWSHQGHTASGADAIAAALKATAGPSKLAGTLLALPPLLWLARAVYPAIARNRHRLPGATDACRLPTAEQHD